MISTSKSISVEAFLKCYPRYKSLGNNSNFLKIFDFLSKPESIVAMAEACKFEKPALYGVITPLEKTFEEELKAESLKSNFNLFKQAVGSAALFLLTPYGYKVNKQRTLPGARFFSSATHFLFDPESAEFLLPGFKQEVDQSVENAYVSEGVSSASDTLTDEQAIKIFETLCISKELGNSRFKKELIAQIKQILIQWL